MIGLNFLCVLLLFSFHTCEAHKILVLFPLPVKSHSILGDGVVRHLLEAGHEVTYMTPYPKAQKHLPLLREIDLSVLQKVYPESLGEIDAIIKKVTSVSVSRIVHMLFNVNELLLKQEEVRKLFSDPKEHFDLIIVEWMFGELYSGISAVFNCPYIWFSTVEPHWMVLRLIDEVSNPAYSSDTMSKNVLPFSFTQRVEELATMVFGLSLQYFSTYSMEHDIYNRLLVPIIQKRGHKVPDLEDLRYNASLMLGNSHISLGSSIHLPSSYKAIGGYHIEDNVKPLPENLKTILDKAKYGLIYFSLGTNLRSDLFPTEIKVGLLEMFGKLNQTVLWKFEEDLPNRPSNVHVMQWIPQQSILAHQNCILFITHGGQLSTTEAIHFSKPFIGIPVFGDQFVNINRFVKLGCAIQVDLSYSMVDQLEKAIHNIIADPSYSYNIQKQSAIYHDRPVLPGKELVHWVEHVIRTGGAPHLRSPALMVPWYQKCYLDLLVLVIVIIYGLKLVTIQIIVTYTKAQKHKFNKVE